MKVFVLTKVNLFNVGYTPIVTVSFSLDTLNAKMKAEYLAMAKEIGLSEEDALDEDRVGDSVEAQFADGEYAFHFGRCYWDIVEKEIEA